MYLLPDDHYGVMVENERDLLCLTWLVRHIGEAKLRRSVAKYNLRYPDCRPYVSLLLKWYRLTVPRSVYAPVYVPVYCVYMLVLADESAVKIGMSGNWVQRAEGMVRSASLPADLSQFDLCRSVSLPVANKKAAIEVEDSVKEKTQHLRCAPPLRNRREGRVGVCWGAGGNTEWRLPAALPLIMRQFEAAAKGAPLVSLREWLNWDAAVHLPVADLTH